MTWSWILWPDTDALGGYARYCSKKSNERSDKMNDLYDAMNEPRYCGIPTFMRTPHITDYNDIDIAFLGIPYDGAVEARSGARQGPRQIRQYRADCSHNYV